MGNNMKINNNKLMQIENLNENIVGGSRPDPCTRLILENRAGVITSWELVTLDGMVMFRSGRYAKRDDCVLRLSEIDIPIGTSFKVRAAVVGNDSTSEEVMYYDPASTVTLFYRLTGTAFKTTLTYLGDIGYDSEDNVSDIVKEASCNKVIVSNIAWVVLKICLLNLDYQTIYISDRYSRNESWSIDLASINVPDGTKLIVKARVIGGKDCASDEIINYQPSANATALYQVQGGVANSRINYLGTV